MHNPIPVTGIPKEFRGTFLNQVSAFGAALHGVNKQVIPLDKDWAENVRTFVARCERSFGLASRDIRLVLDFADDPDLSVRIRTNLTIFHLAKLVGAIGDEACPTRLVAIMDTVSEQGVSTPSGLVCRGNDGDYPSPLDITGWAMQAQQQGGLWICHIELSHAAAAAIIPPVTNKAQRPLILTRSQQSALLRIRKLYNIRGMRMEWAAGVWSRPFPLIVGISGSGKTTIIRHLAQVEDVPCIIVDPGSWIVRGARSEIYTLDHIRASVRSSATGGVLLVDELDKFCGCQSSWDRLVVQELMALLDGRLASAGWTESDLDRFGKWMVVGGATFQSDIRSLSRALGFGGKPDYGTVVSEVLRSQFMIPDELIARFNARSISLEPPNYSDFCRQIRSIIEALRYEPEEGVEQHIDRVAHEAVNSCQNMRFVEAYLCGLLEDTLELDTPLYEASAEDCLDVDSADEDQFELM